MADEFIKGLAALVGGGLAWMVLAGWYNTHGFEETQLLGADPPAGSLGFMGEMALVLRDAFLVFAVVGALTFWLLVPAYREFRERGTEG